MKRIATLIAAFCCTLASLLSCTEGKDNPGIEQIVEIRLSESVVTLGIDGTADLKALDIKDGSTVADVVWISLDESVATVSAGKVTAVSAGSATIRAIAVKGGSKAECKVIVNGPLPPEDIDFGGEGDIEDFH